ncbi:MAG: hypothetical protein AAGB46_05650 [Verrucomicrobiota bacterium]
MKTLSLFAFGFFSVLGLSALQAQTAEPRRPADESTEAPTFGPYVAISINSNIVRDVKVDKEENVFLQLYPAHKDKELIVKISNERFASYRNWWHGKRELVSPANAGKQEYGWTDRVQSKAKYIEYWMDGDVFLHLRRVDF